MPRATRIFTGLITLGMVSTAAASSPAPQADAWEATLESDLRNFHAALASSHPGPVDELNPAFTSLLDQGLATALARVPYTHDFAGYWWAMREFQASFNDGHVQFYATEEAPVLVTRWPGFLTRTTVEGEHKVAVREDDPELPPEGARLVECGGTPPEALARERVGHFRGRWELGAQRTRHGARILLDEGNPWTTLPTSCTFTDGTHTWVHALEWRSIEGDALRRLLDAAGGGHRTGFGLRDARGLAWIEMGGFNGNPSSTDYAALTDLLGALQDDSRLGSAHRVVLDVRGNGGGSSHWSRLVAGHLWGSEAMAALDGSASTVEWRVSAANVEAMQETLKTMQDAEGMDPGMLRWVTQVSDGMQQALERGEALWRQPEWDGDDPGSGQAPTPGRLAEGARVYVLTDSSCASACLDALDLWRALGAVHVGQETSADTLYMDLREQTLPSGLAEIRIPMKVYRGRSRGNNEPHVPDHAWEGDIGDDPAIVTWLSELE